VASMTLSELRLRARQRADMENSNFVDDDEFNYYVNSALQELHDILIQSYGEDYYTTSVTFTTTGGTDSYDLSTIIPAGNFYKMRGVDAQLNGDDYFTLHRFNFNERNRFQNFGVWDYVGITNVRYNIIGSTLKFSPAPDSAISVRLWYIPNFTKLTLDADTFDDINGYSDYVVASAARRAMLKEESNTSALDNEILFLKTRIEEASKNRDAGNSESIRDIYIENSDFFYGRTRS